MKIAVVVFCAVLVPATSLAFGQVAATSTDSDRELIRKLVERIDTLEKRVNELESEKRSVAPSPPPQPPIQLPATEASSAGMTDMAHPEHSLETVESVPTYPSFRLAGFGDFDFSATNQPGDHSGFSEGQFILHMNSALSRRVTFFAELSFTARSDAGLGSPPATGFNMEVERSIIRFDQSDKLKVSFGRYHTPINYWNTQFHHGAWLQTSITRPQMVQFGGSFIPVHFVGALVEGTVDAGGLNLNYTGGLGNGRGQVISRAGDYGDINNNRAWLTSVSVRPDFAYALQVGASVYRDKINPLTGLPSREWIESAHVVWQKENPEVIAEFSNVTHTPVGLPMQFNSQAWYVQTAYRLPFWNRLWKPYYRFEYIHVPKGDTIFAAVPDFGESTAGIRYDISNYVALKFEYRNTRMPGIPRVNGLFAQTSFTF